MVTYFPAKAIKMIKVLGKNLITILVILAPLTAFGSGNDPLSDIIEILGQLEVLQGQISVNTGIISANSILQLKEVQDQWAALTKTYGMDDTKADQNARLWSANDWNQILTQAAGGNNSRFQQLMQSYSKMYPNLNNTKHINATALVNTTYQQSGETDNAALATSAYTYDEINNHINNLESVLHQVDDTNKNQNEKAAIDLNSRLTAELGFINLEMLKLQSIHTQLDATQDQSEFNQNTLDKQFTGYKP